ncbi:Protein FAM65C [Acipenser ruthenus]|uniref:Protein FAM65C n=1 Tax=Acipenser ruthenus TaxID=7906 RepID=A0A444UWV1_ACIRT|nr:Protein FAM65C [Acipenser ruthenus]
METLAVEEEVLGSFDFLSTDFNADELSCLGSVRVSAFREGILPNLGMLPQGTESRTVTERVPLTTGDSSLDLSLAVHLCMCKLLVQNDLYLHKTSSMETLAVEEEVLGSFDFLSTDFNADELSCLGSVRVSAFREGILPNLGMLPQGTESRTVTERVPLTTGDSSLDLSLAVHLCMCKLLVQLLSCSDSSVVQSALLEELSLQADVLEKISKLSLEKSANEYSARDLQLIEALSCPKRRRALKRLKGKRLSQLQPLPQTLQLLAMLQTDENHKVCRGAAACLCRAAAVKNFRAKAIVYYTAALRDSDVQLQRAACMALKCLKAVESVEQIADLWRSGDEDLRNAAREAVLSFGKKGHIVFLKIDKICCELQEEAFQNKDTEITIL